MEKSPPFSLLGMHLTFSTPIAPHNGLIHFPQNQELRENLSYLLLDLSFEGKRRVCAFYPSLKYCSFIASLAETTSLAQPPACLRTLSFGESLHLIQYPRINQHRYTLMHKCIYTLKK